MLAIKKGPQEESPLLESESVCSFLMRKAWAGDYSKTDMSVYLGYRQLNGQVHISFLRLNWYNQRRVFTPDRLPRPNEGELLLLSKLDGFQSIWLSNKFRFCPICLENGYHSYWFQMNSVIKCPVHGCLLSLICHSCGASSPQYCFGQGLFSRSYMCPVCERPICGADPLVQFLRGMREHDLQIRSAFLSLEHWIRSLSRQNILDYCFRFDRLGWHDWCDFSSIQSVLAYRACRLPTEYQRAPRNDVRLLSWKIRMNSKQSGYKKKRKNYFETRFMDGVLRCVMRRLEFWVFGERSFQRLMIASEKKRLLFWPLNPKEWIAKELAYFVFVDAFSNGDWPDLEYGLSGVEFCFSDFNVLREWEGRVSRVTFRNFLYAAYAGLYLKVRAAQRSNINSWAGLRKFNVLDILISKSKVSEDGLSSGFFVFPEIEGFPCPYDLRSGS